MPLEFRIVDNLQHKTFPHSAINIIRTRIFDPDYDRTAPNRHDPYHYDAGMNFLGELGEYENHHLKEKGKTATLFCQWEGCVTENLPQERGDMKFEPNVLYDFNGSSNLYQNNDPRYILPIGSKNLRIIRLEFNSKEDLVLNWNFNTKNLWTIINNKFPSFLKANNWLYKKLLPIANKELNELNQKFQKQNYRIDIREL